MLSRFISQRTGGSNIFGAPAPGPRSAVQLGAVRTLRLCSVVCEEVPPPRAACSSSGRRHRHRRAHPVGEEAFVFAASDPGSRVEVSGGSIFGQPQPQPSPGGLRPNDAPFTPPQFAENRRLPEDGSRAHKSPEAQDLRAIATCLLGGNAFMFGQGPAQSQGTGNLFYPGSLCRAFPSGGSADMFGQPAAGFLRSSMGRALCK